jgi:NAD(P)H-flavin reductase
MVPTLASIVAVTEESSNTRTYTLRIDDPELRSRYRFRPGQFNMLYLFGIGEAAISISSDPAQRDSLAHTIRHCGSVTFGIGRMRIGEKLGLRGPFGSSWPLERCEGRDLLLVAGGIGLAPLRPAIYQILANRPRYGRVVLIYGGRAPKDLLFQGELETWSDHPGIDALVTVDYPMEEWAGPVGAVTNLLKRVRLRGQNTSVLVCGPRIMNRFVAFQLLRLQVPTDHLFVSLERNMRCGVGRCGHCQYGPKFVCKDGPVLSYRDLQSFFAKEEI